VVLLGDGSFLICTNELANLARYAIPALVIVLDNGGCGTERPIVDGPFNDLQPVAHRELALAMGFNAAERVVAMPQLLNALGLALGLCIRLLQVAILPLPDTHAQPAAPGHGRCGTKQRQGRGNGSDQRCGSVGISGSC